MKIINKTRFFGMLGFAMRAGKIDTGADVVCDLMQRGKAHLVIISNDASDLTRKRLRNKCEFYKVKCIEPDLDSYTLSERLGKTNTTVCIAIKDEGFKCEILKTLEDGYANMN